MKETFIEIDCTKFNDFLSKVMPNHHSNCNDLLNYLIYKKLHGLDVFQKNYINQVLENYYGIHFKGISPRDKEKYFFSVTDKKLCTFFKIQYGI